MKIEPIPREELDRALRSLCKRIGAELVRGMAAMDADFAYMSMRLGKPEEYVRHCVHDLIEGQPLDLNTISDLAVSLGLYLNVDVVEVRT